MKKEQTIITTIELTEIYKGDMQVDAEEIELSFKNLLQTYNYDDAHIKVKVFEFEKEERISTEELADFANRCASVGCYKCPFYEKADSKNDCRGKLIKELADRLEELHNQQTATQTKPTFDCDDCKHRNKFIWAEPCKQCNGNYDKWERA